MNKQTRYLLNEIKRLTKEFDLKAKYEYNSDIDIHFVLMYSDSLDIEVVDQLSDQLYLEFVTEFPDGMVAVMDRENKYKFRFESLFDNTFESLYASVATTKVKCNEKIVLNEVSYDKINISELINGFANNYNRKTIYKDSLSLDSTISIETVIDGFNDEFAFAA